MNVRKLMDKYISDNPKSTMPRYYKIINRLMGRYIINKIDKPTMKRLLVELDHMQYETGYAVANDKLLLQADMYRSKKMNMRLHYHITSSTLFNVLEGKRVSIEFAVEFCKINNLRIKDYFNIFSVKKYYSIENKECIKGRIKYLFDYAVDKKLIESSPVPKKYSFKVDERISVKYLSSYSLKMFVDTMLKLQNRNSSVMALVYILVKFDRNIAINLKIKNFNFKKRILEIEGETILMSKFVSNYLEDYFSNENPENNVVTGKTKGYLKTIIYKIRDKCNQKDINLETLSYNYKDLMDYINSYSNEDEEKIVKSKEICKENNINFNDFKEFLKLKKMYEEAAR